MKKAWCISFIILLMCSGVSLAQLADTLEMGFSKVEYKFDPNATNVINDTFTLKFNLYKVDYEGERVRGLYLDHNDIPDIKAEEFKGSDPDRFPISYIPNSFVKLNQSDTAGAIPDDITISLLVDYSGTIDDGEMSKIKEAIKAFVEKVPEGCLYFSWFSDDVSESVLLTKDNFDAVTARKSRGNTALYNAIYTKLLEFDPAAKIPNLEMELNYKRNEEIARRKGRSNNIIILTDGVNDVVTIEKYHDPAMEVINSPQLINALKKYSKEVKVFTIGFGENSDAFDEMDLIRICKASGNPDGYFLVQPDNILHHFEGQLAEQFSTEDYAIQLIKEKGATYVGNPRTIEIVLNSNNQLHPYAIGSVDYRAGSAHSEVTVGEVEESIWGEILKGVILGIVLWLVIMIVMQLIIPLIKNRFFNMKYARKYKPGENELHKECPYCGDPLNAGDRVITKCEHIVHKACWSDFDHVCPEYGQNCNDRGN